MNYKESHSSGFHAVAYVSCTKNHGFFSVSDSRMGEQMREIRLSRHSQRESVNHLDQIRSDVWKRL